MLKILQARLQQYVNQELPDVQTGYRKGRGTRHQIAKICWIIEKAREFQKNVCFFFCDYAKAFDCLSSAQFNRSVVFNSLGPHGLQHTRLLCPLATPGPCSNSHPSSQWCHPTISSTVISVSSCLQSFPASGSFPVSQFFAWGSQSFGASASVLLMSIQDWFPLGLTGLISCRRKDSQESRVQKHQFFGVHLSLWSNSSMTAGIIIALTR